MNLEYRVVVFVSVSFDMIHDLGAKYILDYRLVQKSCLAYVYEYDT